MTRPKQNEERSAPPERLSLDEQRRRIAEEEAMENAVAAPKAAAAAARKPRRRASRPRRLSKSTAFVMWGDKRAPELTRAIDEGLQFANDPAGVLLTLAESATGSLGGTPMPGLMSLIEETGREKLRIVTLFFRDKLEESTLTFLPPKHAGRALLELKALSPDESKTRIEIAAFFHEPPASSVITDKDDQQAIEECFNSCNAKRSSKTPGESRRLRNKVSDGLDDSLEVLYAVSLARPSLVATTRGPKNTGSFLIHPAMIIFQKWPEWKP